MLTHENLAANSLAAFGSMAGLEPDKPEVVLSFLPLSHGFARTLIYGHIAHGHSLYFTTPNRVIKHLQEIQPTTFTTIPRLLEKVYDRIQSRGQRLKGIQKCLFNWAWGLSQRYELGHRPGGLYHWQLQWADRLVFHHWRQVFGGKLKYLISGGAALKAEIANGLAAAGIPILQGYGLTEASAVVCFNRGALNRAGTVGMPIPGVEVAIAPNQEILLRSPYVMRGYYRNPRATAQVLEPDGWLHTGDLGHFTPEGFLTITGCQKALFKLSTGKYVVPLPLERRLKQSPLVAQAIAVGAQRKFCSMLIFPNLINLRERAMDLELGLELPIEDLLYHPQTLEIYQTLVDEANRWLPTWSTVKLFRLIDPALTEANGLAISTLGNQRDRVREVFAREINDMY
jgi:long-chain acyl-CoA synthetase